MMICSLQKRFLLASMTCVLLSAFVGAVGAQDKIETDLGKHEPPQNSDDLHIPEPMIFDLVRGLGARQGELEVNVLGEFPLNNSASRHIEWAPEIEYAIYDGIALELEFPFEDGKLDAYKGALQWTFGQSGNFIHGTQFIVEKTNDKDVLEGSALYIPAYRFNDVWSAIAMIGVRQEFGYDSKHETTSLLLNASVFAEITERTTLGLELNYSDPDHSDGEEAERKLLLMPQLHYEFTDNCSIQTGVGVEFTESHSNATAAARLIFTF